MVAKKAALVFILFLCSLLPLYSEVETTVEIEVYNTLSMLDKESVGYSATGIGSLTFTAAGTKNIKAELSIEGIVSNTPMLNLSRGYIKARFPGFRITLGKAPISWGNGFAFNGGDVVFRKFAPTENLSSEILRDDAALLSSAYIPLGSFSFAEILVLPPEIDFTALLSDPNYISPPIVDTKIGARSYLEMGPLGIEPGYVYDGSIDTHFPYIGIQGFLWADWYIAASLGIETRNPVGERIYETYIMSAGASYSASFESGGSLTLRLESLIYPAGEWREVEDSNNSGAVAVDVAETGTPAEPSPYPQYGLLLYPELSWGISESAALFLRSIFSPVDMSAVTSFGGSWNIFTGFDLLGFAAIQGGDETDTYAYGSPGWFSLSLGARYIF